MKRDVDRSYLAIVVLLMLVLPLASLLIETREPGLVLVGKWWNFWAIGVRLFTAGLRQVAKPAFTAEVIFHATCKYSHEANFSSWTSRTRRSSRLATQFLYLSTGPLLHREPGVRFPSNSGG
jgi:hypothetical protein